MKRFIVILALLVPVLAVAAPKEIRTVSFKTHLHCENCVKKVVENISYVKGVKDLEVSLEKQEINVKYDAAKTDESKLAAEIVKLGYPAVNKAVNPDAAVQEIPVPEHGHKH